MCVILLKTVGCCIIISLSSYSNVVDNRKLKSHVSKDDTVFSGVVNNNSHVELCNLISMHNTILQKIMVGPNRCAYRTLKH